MSPKYIIDLISKHIRSLTVNDTFYSVCRRKKTVGMQSNLYMSVYKVNLVCITL